MGPIPLINVIAVIHLSMICMFLGVFAAESVLELSGYFGKQSQEKLFQTIRLHYWIDNLVELPIVTAIIASGIVMVLMVDQITLLHYVKIGLVVAALLCGLPCVIMVNRRYHAMQNGAPDIALRKTGKSILQVVTFFMSPFLFAGLGLGFFLAYTRISYLIAG